MGGEGVVEEEGFLRRAANWFRSRFRWSFGSLFKPFKIYDEVFEEPDYGWILLLFVLTCLAVSSAYTLLQAYKIKYYDVENSVYFTFIDVYGWMTAILMNFFSNTVNMGLNLLVTALILYLASWLLGGDRNFAGTILCVGYAFTAYLIFAAFQYLLLAFTPEAVFRITSRVEVVMLLSSIQALRSQISAWSILDTMNLTADAAWRNSIPVQISNTVTYLFPLWVITSSGIGVGKLTELDRTKTMMMQGITAIAWLTIFVTIPRILGG